MRVRVGYIAWGKSISATCPSVFVSLFAVDIHRDRGFDSTDGIIDHDDMGPLSDLIGNQTGHIKTRAPT